MMRGAGAARWFFPPLARGQIERRAWTEPLADGVRRTHGECRGLPPCVIEQGVVDPLHSTTVAQILAEASLQPQRSRYGKTAPREERVTPLAAKVRGCYERGGHERGEGGRWLDEKPTLPALARAAPRQRLHAGPLERREFE